MNKKIVAFCTFVTLSLVGAVAYAQSVSPDTDPAGFFSFLLGKLQSGEWLAAFGAALVGIVWVLRTLLAPKISWFGTKLGGWVLSFGAAGALAVGTAIMASGPAAISLSLVMTALSAALAASGGYEAIRDLLASKGE